MKDTVTLAPLQVTATQPVEGARTRLLSLDVVRGITIAFMILVNDNGDMHHAYWPLKHSEWNGWTPTDLVFPAFLFIVGTAIVFSTDSRRARGESKGTLLLHAFRRAAILFLLGLVVNGFPYFHLATLRIYGVLQRIAICYLLATILYLWKPRFTWLSGIAAASLLGYWILMRWVPIPGYGVPGRDFPFMDKAMNWVSVVDRKLFPGRLYVGIRDPEGLLSNIPALGTVLLGILAGLWLRGAQSLQRKTAGLLLAAVCGLGAGELWSIWFPMNKNLWTSSFVLFTAGCTFLLLAICYWLIEVRQWNGRWTIPWKVFGANAIVAYVFSELLASALENIHLSFDGQLSSLQQIIYEGCFSWVSDLSFRSLLYSLTYVFVCFVPVAILYRKRVFIKI